MMRNTLSHGIELLATTESFFARRIVFLFAVIALGTAVAIRFSSAVGGDWYASGDDMRHILPELREGTPSDWITGPWIGKRIFDYYRPVTSVAMWAEYQAFGEDQADWQTISLISHSVSAVLLACFLFTLFGSAIPAIVGSSIWAFRWRMVEAMEWVPAQTDLFAGLFAITGLLLFSYGLRAWRIPFLALSAIAMLLAIGCKEVALVVPGVAVAIGFMHGVPTSRQKTSILFGAIGIVAISLVVRILAMKTIGFLPGDKVAGTFGANEITLGSVVVNLTSFVLPTPLTSAAKIGAPAAWIAGLGAVAAWFAFRFRWIYGLIIATVAFLAITLLLDEPAYWRITETRYAVVAAIVSAGLVAAAICWAQRRGFMVAICGLVFALPLYHVVYNPAGNVQYVPEIYWAMAWALLFTGVLERLSHRGETSKTIAAAHSADPS